MIKIVEYTKSGLQMKRFLILKVVDYIISNHLVRIDIIVQSNSMQFNLFLIIKIFIIYMINN